MQNNHILAESNIKKLLIKLSLPAITGMFVMALYNIVDTIFVGRGVGALGIAGLSIVFPLQMLVMAVGQLLGIGGASIISRSLGAGNLQKSNQVLGTVIFTIIIISFIITTMGLLFSKQLLILFGASKTIFPYARDYYQIIILGSILFITSMSCNNILRAEGQAKVAMFIMIIGAVLNIILDPIFIFALKMGVKGAALATVLSKSISVLYLLFFLQSGKSTLRIKLKHFKIRFSILREIFAIGLSSFMQNAAGSFVFALVNNKLGFYGGDVAIAAYGIVIRFMRFLIMPLIGIAQGLQPISGFNYGAKKFDKVKEVIKLAIIYSTLIAFTGWIISELFAKTLVGIFTNDVALIETGSHALRIMMLVLPIIGFQIVVTTVFQSLGKAVQSLVLSMSRQILFFVPLVLVLPKLFGLNGIWIAAPVADVLSVLLTCILFYRLIKQMNREIRCNNKIVFDKRIDNNMFSKQLKEEN